MNTGFQPTLDFAAADEAAEDGAALVIDIDGYEGPLHLLLDLARRHKIDLVKVSILALSDQYLIWIHEAREKRIDLAADYLLMAAWLAFLKSKLLLPSERKATLPVTELVTPPAMLWPG